MILQKVSQQIRYLTVLVSSTGSVLVAALSLVLYIAVGLWLGFSESYNMVANTIMSAVSYMLLFILQNAQNHDSKALHVKLDEVILALHSADNCVLGAEGLTAGQLEKLDRRYQKLGQQHRELNPLSGDEPGI